MQSLDFDPPPSVQPSAARSYMFVFILNQLLQSLMFDLI